MKILFASFFVCFCCSVATPALKADEPDSVDALRKEIRSLKLRVAQLEQQVQKLSQSAPKPVITIIKIDQDGRPIRAIERPSIPVRPGSIPSVEEVLKLQIESPGSLLKNIHERERMLRGRFFYPEVFGR